MAATKKAGSKAAPKKSTSTQRDHRRGVTVGAGMTDVSPAAYWYRHGHFESEEEARGAFKLAYQQGLDGMGASIAGWMGLTSAEYDGWMRSNALPAKGKRGEVLPPPRPRRGF